jgi:hypothetical protein
MKEVNSEVYGTYKVEKIFEINYLNGVQEEMKKLDLWEKYFPTKISFCEKKWDKKFKSIEKDIPWQIEGFYYPTEKSAPGHLLNDDKTLAKFKKELKKLERKD